MKSTEIMNAIAEKIVRGSFHKLDVFEAPVIKLWHNKWDDHVAILKVKFQ